VRDDDKDQSSWKAPITKAPTISSVPYWIILLLLSLSFDFNSDNVKIPVASPSWRSLEEEQNKHLFYKLCRTRNSDLTIPRALISMRLSSRSGRCKRTLSFLHSGGTRKEAQNVARWRRRLAVFGGSTSSLFRKDAILIWYWFWLRRCHVLITRRIISSWGKIDERVAQGCLAVAQSWSLFAIPQLEDSKIDNFWHFTGYGCLCPTGISIFWRTWALANLCFNFFPSRGSSCAKANHNADLPVGFYTSKWLVRILILRASSRISPRRRSPIFGASTKRIFRDGILLENLDWIFGKARTLSIF